MDFEELEINEMVHVITKEEEEYLGFIQEIGEKEIFISQEKNDNMALTIEKERIFGIHRLARR